MDAKRIKTLYKMSEDTVDYGDKRYDIGYVEQHENGDLEVTLDTNPIENRLYCYNNNGKWAVANYHGRQVKEVDQEIMDCLVAISNRLFYGS